MISISISSAPLRTTKSFRALGLEKMKRCLPAPPAVDISAARGHYSSTSVELYTYVVVDSYRMYIDRQLEEEIVYTTTTLSLIHI